VSVKTSPRAGSNAGHAQALPQSIHAGAPMHTL